MERQFDVIVVGGGTAGFAAAVTAARGGAKTLLIEEKAYLGGTATGAQVSMFMGFADGEPDRPQQGIIKDVMDGLAAAGGTPGIETIYLCGRRDLDIPVIPYESEILKDLIFDLVDQAGVELLLHTRVIGAQVEDGVITALTIHNEQGVQTVSGKVVIDASFHGSVAVSAGCRCDQRRAASPSGSIHRRASGSVRSATRPSTGERIFQKRRALFSIRNAPLKR